MNRRKLKKEINSIAEQLADRCLAKEQNNPSEINKIIDDIAELIDDTMYEIGRTSEFVGPEVKVHYAGIHKSFDERIEALEARLEKVQ